MGRKQQWRDLETVPASSVPIDLIADGSYRQSGFQCWVCSWRTTKVGYSGRQAVRAHSRVHAYERGSWQRPLVIFALLAILALTLAILGHLDLIRFDPLARVQVPAGIRLGALAVPLTLAVIVGGTIYTVWYAVSPVMLWTLRAIAVCCLLPGVAVLAVALGLIDVPTGRTEQVIAALSWTVGAAFACGAGYVRLLLRRRMREPSGYTELARAKDDEAESELRWRVSKARRSETKPPEKGRPPRPKQEAATRRATPKKPSADRKDGTTGETDAYFRRHLRAIPA